VDHAAHRKSRPRRLTMLIDITATVDGRHAVTNPPVRRLTDRSPSADVDSSATTPRRMSRIAGAGR
jgi:hypothetical protein